jgi:hypothetical protein
MKKFLSTFFQFVLFYLTFAVGSFLPVFHLPSITTPLADGTRAFVWDGVILMGLLLVVVLLIEASRKRIRTAGMWTAAAFVLALVLGLASKFGFKTL